MKNFFIFYFIFNTDRHLDNSKSFWIKKLKKEVIQWGLGFTNLIRSINYKLEKKKMKRK